MPESRSSARPFQPWVSDPRHRGGAPGGGGSRAAFTLVELLVVLGLIAMLAGLVFGAGQHAAETGRKARARAELSALAAGLESYRRLHGDYPHTRGAANDPGAAAPSATDGPGILFNALRGRRDPAGLASATSTEVLAGQPALVLQRPDEDAEANAFVDPWGRRYLYFYKTGGAAAWQMPGFVLYSVGPNGTHQPPGAGSGWVDPLAAENADNLYANP